MLKALMLKELRDVRGIAVLALLIYTFLLTYAILPALWWDYVPVAQMWENGRPSETMLPFIRDSFTPRFLVASAVLAVALGLWQSVGETKRGTFAFLLHRPVTRRQIIVLKLSVGVTTYLLCAAIPLLAYSFWAATPGTHAGPFEWSMSWPAWTRWWATTLVYAGAFLTGIRPARWYGTRLLPLIVAVVGFAISAEIALNAPQAMPWVCLAILAADIWLISAILFVTQTRDFS
jgi:hypothetical protein